jgi:hypothetical protein
LSLKSGRLLKCTDFGDVAYHEFWKGKGARSALLSGGKRVGSPRQLRRGLVGGDFCGAEIVEFFDFGCGKRVIVDADVVYFGSV